MILGSDKGDVSVAGKLAEETGCDVWFPYYPLCTDHCITESYDIAFECYRQMIELYGNCYGIGQRHWGAAETAATLD